MNKKIISIALALALPLTVAAFPGGDPAGMAAHDNARIERMAKNLDLSADQKAKVEVIFKEQHDKMRAIHDETRTRIQGVLSKEQIAKMEAMKKEHHGKIQKKLQAVTNSGDPAKKQ